MCVCAAVGMAKASGVKSSLEEFRFDGVHLRMEADASRWVAANGGLSKTWDSYLNACTVRSSVFPPKNLDPGADEIRMNLKP